jgi:multicomponent Na+:H+ antiporter subunit D
MIVPSPSLPVALPLIAAAVLASVRKWLRRWMGDIVAVATAAVNLALCLLLLIACRHENIVYWFGNWFPRGRMALGIGFEVDPAGAGLASLASLLILLAVIYSWRSMENTHHLYQPLMLIFLSAMCGFSLTADLFNLFVFFELMSIAAFALCGLKTKEPAPLQGSFNFAITNTVGAFFILTGIALVYAATGALNMGQIGWLLGSRHDSLVLSAAAFMIAGFLIKAAAAPFHFWLPDAHSVAPTPVCVIFSGLMVELGAFAVLRLTAVMFGQSLVAPHAMLRSMLLFVASLTVLWGGLMCFAEHHLKRILAFSTISHGGAMLLGVAIASPASVAGWLTYLFAHAMTKAGLFFTAGILLHRLETMSEPALFARGRPFYFTAALWLLGGLALAGVPPFGFAVGEDLIEASVHAHALGLWVSFLFFFTGALTAAAVFRVFLRVFAGLGDPGPSDRASQVDELPESNQEHAPIPAHMFLPAGFCILASMIPAFVPHAARYFFVASARFLSQPLYIHRIYAEPFTLQLRAAPHPHLASELLHGLIAAACAALLALAAVLHKRIPRPLRIATRIEGRFFPLRPLQSGHPGDYVVWCMVGFAIVGGCLFLLP